MTQIRPETQLMLPPGGTGTTYLDDTGSFSTPSGGGGGGGGGGSALLNAIGYNPSSAVTKSTTSLFSSAYVDVDATNLAIPFTAPASGQVIVTVNCLVDIDTSGKGVILALRESTTTLAGTGVAVCYLTQGIRAHAEFLISGLTSGSSHTYKLAWSVTGGTAHMYIGGGNSNPNGPAVMKVWSA